MERISFSINQLFPAFLTFLSFVSLLHSGGAARTPAASNTNTAFIKASCSTTTYPAICYNSLSIHANAINNDPKLLAHMALSVALSTARSTSISMVKLFNSGGLKPREIAAMGDCVEELSDSVDQLTRSIGEMEQMKGGSTYAVVVNDVQTWVSAALTDDDTCMEGFGGKAMDGNLKSVIRRKVLNIAHLTSNALALINSYVAIHG